jgi:hypothetical protein
MLSIVTTPLSSPLLVHYLIEQDKWRLLRVYGVDITHLLPLSGYLLVPSSDYR